MARIRRVRTSSGATAVQIAESADGRRRIVAHVGSAHTEAELGLLVERARALLQDPGQGEFELGIEPVAAKTSLVAPAGGDTLFGERVTTTRKRVTAAAPRVISTASRVLYDPTFIKVAGSRPVRRCDLRANGPGKLSLRTNCGPRVAAWPMSGR